MNKEEIKKVRKNMKMNQTNFGKMLGVGLRSVQHWESGERNISETALLLLKDKIKSEHSTHLKEDTTPYIIKHNNGKIEDPIVDVQDIPLYDIEVTAGVVTLFKNPSDSIPIGTIKIPKMPKCDGAFAVTGDSMYPIIKSGDYVFYKVITDLPNSIFFGNMYIVSMDIEGDELVMVKYVKKGKDENHILLVSENQHHAEKEIHIKYLSGMALVKGSVRFNFTT